MNQIKPWQERVKPEYHNLNIARDFMQAEINELRQAIEQVERADKEAGFEMWWGEFMPSAFRNRAWEAWSMAHPSAIKQAEKDVLNVLTLEQGGVNSPPPSAPGVMNEPLESLYRRTEKLRQAPDQWTDADSDAARLALELECLLLDTKDMAAVSKWWDSANDALELHCQRLAAPTAPAQPLTCTWTPEDDDNMPGTWASSCGELWSFIDGGPDENRVSYCHHCGGKVVIGDKK